MSYWLFKCNPKYYRIHDRLADPEPRITWSVWRYRKQIQAGDTAFIALTVPYRSIVAVVRIEQGPTPMAEWPSEASYNVQLDLTERLRVCGRLVDRPDPITAEAIQAVPGLRDLAAFRRRAQGVDFALTDEQGRLLMDLVRRRRR